MGDYGRMCSFDDAIKWAERQPDSQFKEWAIARMRYEADKARPLKPKFHKGIYGKRFDHYTCSHCGRSLEISMRFCPGCGRQLTTGWHLGE